jgi:Fic family protein
MEGKIHDYNIILNWTMLNAINSIERFDSCWDIIMKREGQSLEQLKQLGIIRSVAASARIKGVHINERGIGELLKKKNPYMLKDNIEKEIIGYYETHKHISESFSKLKISEFTIKNFHKILFKYSGEDYLKRGNYSQVSKFSGKQGQATQSMKGFRTTLPTFTRDNLMQELVAWYHSESIVHPLVRIAVFTYSFLSVNPFEKGSHRTARLLAVFLLLKSNYKWIQYVSFDQEIEIREPEYMRVSGQCQHEEEGENINAWILLFLDVLKNLQQQLMQKLKSAGSLTKLTTKQKSVLLYIETHAGCKSGEIAANLFIANSTAKRLLKELSDKNLIERLGRGAGCNYIIC